MFIVVALANLSSTLIPKNLLISGSDRQKKNAVVYTSYQDFRLLIRCTSRETRHLP